MTKQHTFKIVGGDTDSIMFCKEDESPFTENEQKELIAEINALLPEMIKYDSDGMFPRVIYLKTKNYIMVDMNGKRTIKGSSLKSATLEPVLKQMLSEFIDAILEDKKDTLIHIYNRYVNMVDNIVDITPWAKKMSLSPKTFESIRPNETRVVDAIQGTEYKSGDKIYVYRTDIGLLKLAEQFDGCYNKDAYYEKLYKTTLRFETVLPVKDFFKNFKLKKNKKTLTELLESK